MNARNSLLSGLFAISAIAAATQVPTPPGPTLVGGDIQFCGKIVSAGTDSDSDGKNDRWSLDLTPDIAGDLENSVTIQDLKESYGDARIAIGTEVKVDVEIADNNNDPHKVVSWVSIGG